MFASRGEQENAPQTRHLTAAGKPLQGVAPKTPAKQSTRHDRRERSDENILRSGGKTGGKKNGQAFVTPVARTARAPLTVRAANTRAFLKTPQPTIRPEHRPVSSIKRTRRAQFKVHQAEDDQNEVVEEREIEYMAPRGEPLPDLPDEDIWPHDRTYEQLKGDTFYKGWTLSLFDSDDEDFESRYQRALENEARSKQVQAIHDVPPTSSVQSHIGPVVIKSVKGYASATTASIARSTQSRTPKPMQLKKHSMAPNRAKSALSGPPRAVSRASASSNHSIVQLSAKSSQAAAHFIYLEDDALTRITTDILELEGLSDFQLDIPDD